MLLPLLEKTINAYLKLDDDSAQRLHKLNGKAITVELLPMHFIFQLHADANKILLHPGETVSANAKVIGTPLQLGALALDKQNRHAFFADDIRIEGDAELANQMIAVFDELDIDWEEYSSKWIGDIAAHQLGRTLKKIRHWVGTAQTSFSQDINDYVHEELELFPPRIALEDFYTDIDQLRMAVDRLEARAALLLSATETLENDST